MQDGFEPTEGEPLASLTPLDDSIPLARPVTWSPPAPEILLMNQSRQAAWKDILLFVVLFLALGVLGEILMGRIYAGWTGHPADADPAAQSQFERALLFPALTWRTILAILLTAFIARRRGQSPRSLGVTARHLPLHLLIGAGTAAASGFVIAIVTLTLMSVFPAIERQMQENGARIIEHVPKASPAAFAGVTLLIGIYEELIFRGFLMPRLRRATGSWTIAVLLTTIVFSGLHLFDQVPAALILVTILSLSYSLVTVWRQSIVPAVLAHALFDFVMFLNLYYQAGDRWK